MIVEKLSLEQLQKLFPGANIHRKWLTKDSFDNGPKFAMLLLLGAKVIHNPRGNYGFVSIIKDDRENVLYKDDYDFSLKLASVLLTNDLLKVSYSINSIKDAERLLTAIPSLILESVDFLKQYCQREDAMKYNTKARLVLTIPDAGACGYYRTKLLHNYLKEKYDDKFYIDATISISYSAFSYYDCISYNRVPGQFPYGVFQNLKLEGKVFLYESDDDILNIPKWSVASDFVPNTTQTIFVDSLKDADVVYTTNDYLKNKMIEYSKSEKNQDKFFTCPNLIDLKRFKEPLKCDRRLQKQYAGFRPHRSNTGLEFINTAGSLLEDKYKDKISSDYDPIRILWFGSQTHDEDLKSIVEPVLELGKKFGMAIKFIFFGYCPIEFISGVVGKGNMHQSLEVKEEYSHFIESVDATSFENYVDVIRSIDPDIGLCPIADHDFNNCKSNLKILELGALGIPVVASDFGPYRFIRNGVNGLLASNSDEWRYKIEDLICNHGVRKEIGCNIHETVRDQWSWDTDSENRRMWDRMIDYLHKTIIERKSKISDDGLKVLANSELT